jgi:hypothetical protein
MSKCTILVQTLTRERLKKIGRKGQSYDELINWLIQNVNELSLKHALVPSAEQAGQLGAR